LLEVRAGGGVDGQGLPTGSRQGLGQLQIAVGLLPVRQVQLPATVGIGADHGVQAGVLSGPRELHVQPVDVLGAGEPDQGPPPGQPLGAVAGGGVGQVDPPVPLPLRAAIQVGPGQGDRLVILAVEAEGQGAGLGVESGDDAAAAVGHPQLGDGVVATHDPVADGQLAVLDLEPLASEAAPGGQQLLAEAVKPVDLAPAGSQHHHLLGWVVVGLVPGRPPVLEQGQGGGRLGVGGHHPVMGLVGGDRLLHQAGADQVEGFAFPGLLLAAVLRELGGAEAKPQGAEAAAGVDRRQLPVITNQDDLGPGAVGVLKQAAHLATAHHAGLIDHQYGAGVQLLPSSVQVAEEPVAGGHLLEPLPLQAHGRDPGRCRGQQPVAVQLPGVASHAQREGLTGPGPPHHEGHPLAALVQVPDHRLLILASGRMGGQGIVHGLMGDDRRLFVCPAGRGLDQPLLDRQQLGGGPAALLQSPVGDHADRPLGQEPIRQLLKLGSSGAGQAGTRATRTSGRAKVDACSVNPSGPTSRSNSRPIASSDTVWSCGRSAVRPVTVRTRVSGSCPRSAASVRQRP
jgi:hypothetical protein